MIKNQNNKFKNCLRNQNNLIYGLILVNITKILLKIVS